MLLTVIPGFMVFKFGPAIVIKINNCDERCLLTKIFNPHIFEIILLFKILEMPIQIEKCAKCV